MACFLLAEANWIQIQMCVPVSGIEVTDYFGYLDD